MHAFTNKYPEWIPLLLNTDCGLEDSETESLRRQRAGSKTYKMYITAIITR